MSITASKHTELIGKTDAELRELAPEATHQHYKGGLYRVIGAGLHTETNERLMAYEHVHPYPRQLYFRPVSMFTGFVDLTGSGIRQPRFREIDQKVEPKKYPKKQGRLNRNGHGAWVGK